ncbi:hypothetical protein FDO65_08405 [Nakamurella flava]|uniref:Solute-binding protein family 5 domain-containing protein n=1 Tax=Nakamurella flava TaxID=2576308 RepID=A0A4U6QND5_9ACTN|nr:ABC transporter substrate-binding protein [Nakamurella flava]TKV61572.1 hypothetical protein FDO65_08405 [Nakamurella flava]
MTLTRRRLLRVGTLGAAALAAAACTPYGLPAPIAPSGESSASARPPEPGTIVVGLDGPGVPVTGFNPYAIADWSPAAAAVAGLVLPSVFTIGRDGRAVIDVDVVDAVTVTSTEPFTVTYTLDRKASWSDGTPVTAEDFAYLRDQLLTQPATVDTAGYRLITAIRSRDAGKTVDVEFATSFPGYPSLFSPLLPSHILKDSPAGWAGALSSDIPVSGGRFRMNPYDPVTGQITLARNDKYWGAQPGPAAVVLRLGSPADLIAAYGRGDVQALWLAPGAETDALLDDAVPAERRVVVPAPATVQLVFNAAIGPGTASAAATGSPSTTGATTAGGTGSAGRLTLDPAVRAAIAQAVVPADVAAELGAGRAAGVLPVRSQVRLPAQSDGAAVEGDWSSAELPVPTGDAAAARRRLSDAGWTTDGLYATRGGEVLTLTLGYPSGHRRLAAVARTLQTQLGAAGIQVVLLADAATTLLATRVATGSLDLALVTVPRGADDAVAAATAFSCPRVAGASSGASAAVEPLVDAAAGRSETTAEPEGDAASTSTAPSTTTATPDAAAAVATEPRTGNLSGLCSSAVQPGLVAALAAGTVPDVDEPLWAALPVLPLAQPTTTFAVGSGLQSLLDGPVAGWTWTTPLQGAQNWPSG